MATAQLRLLGVLGFELLADTVKQLHVGLLRVPFQRGDESPGHCTGRLAADVGVLSTD